MLSFKRNHSIPSLHPVWNLGWPSSLLILISCHWLSDKIHFEGLSFPTCRCSWSCRWPAVQDSWVSVFLRTNRQGQWSDACVQSTLSGRGVDMSRTACHSCALEEPVWHKNHNTTFTVQSEGICKIFILIAILFFVFFGPDVALWAFKDLYWWSLISVDEDFSSSNICQLIESSLTQSIKSDVNVKWHCRWQQV